MVIAVTAALLNLVSVAAAYGVLAHFLRGGCAGQLVAIDAPAPLAGYVPVIMFAILFGLSMDDEVFLLSRISEAWAGATPGQPARHPHLGVRDRSGDHRRRHDHDRGLRRTHRARRLTLKALGIGMTSALVVDATVVRMLLVPAVMQLLGERNWWLPAVLARRLPRLHVEGPAASVRPAAD